MAQAQKQISPALLKAVLVKTDGFMPPGFADTRSEGFALNYFVADSIGPGICTLAFDKYQANYNRGVKMLALRVDEILL